MKLNVDFYFKEDSWWMVVSTDASEEAAPRGGWFDLVVSGNLAAGKLALGGMDAEASPLWKEPSKTFPSRRICARKPQISHMTFLPGSELDYLSR